MERRLKFYRELTPPRRGRLESRVGHGVVKNPGLQAVAPTVFCLGWALCVATDVCFGFTKFGKPGLEGSGCRLSSS